MPDNWIEFQSAEVQQPIGTFYAGVIDGADLVAISYSDVHRIEQREVEVLAGIERPLSIPRVKELAAYVRTVDASFPTSVILAVSSEHATFDRERRLMRIVRDEKVAKILDGQHRIAGLKEGGAAGFQVNVIFFVDMELEDQALIFSTINLKQTRVSKSLAYNLFEYATTRSPQKTAHNIARVLNREQGSPFKDKIKILGVATGKVTETLTQATIVDRLLEHISDSTMRDRDTLKRGKKLPPVSESEQRRLIFRKWFLEERDGDILRVLWNYFSAVRGRWPEAWDVRREGNILNRTTGFNALMRFVRDVVLWKGARERVPTEAEFAEVFKRIRIREEDFSPAKYEPGSGGEGRLYRELKELSGVSAS